MMDASNTASGWRATGVGATPVGAVHQFHPSCAHGDGITNGMFLTQKLLRRLGHESEIYCEHIPPELAGAVQHASKLEDRPGDVLLFHHSLGYPNLQWLKDVRARKVLVYHNITPDFLLPQGALRSLSQLGRDQLQDMRPLFEASIGDSEENAQELEAMGYRHVRVLPLLVDLERSVGVQPNQALIASLQDSVNILFVGRVADNKRQLDVIDCFNLYHRHFEPRARLHLPGSTTSRAYLELIQRKVRDLELEGVVSLPGKVSDEDLVAYYRAADVYLSLSEHEGFGMPLIEAMAQGVPVVAHGSTSIPWTVGTGGLLLKTREPEYVAATLDRVVSNPGLRRAMRRGARRSLGRFALPVLERELGVLLRELGGTPARSVTVAEPRPGCWRIEGPFDSTYSLAIVNRNLALALSRTGTPTGLLSTEGGGDFPPDRAFLALNPAIEELVETGKDALHQDVSLRFCYPPRTEGMLGLVRAVHSYGWEETGFPQRYVNWFNQRLDLVTVLSSTVKKVLMDAGVRVPIAVVGAGSDHLVSPREPLLPSERGAFRFLHVSSCFPRKAPDVLLEAWRRAFTRDDRVCLVIKTFPNPHHSMDADVEAFRAKYPNAAPVEVINLDLPDEALARLYQTADAYVSAARGEGYGLPLAEAMRNGLPVITTRWGGQTDFCDDQTAWMVDYAFDYSRSHLVEGVSLWAEPDVEHLAARLKEVFSTPEAARRERTDRAREKILAESSWAKVAMRTQAAVNALSSLPQLDQELKIGWVTTWNSRCGIAEYSRYLIDEMRGLPGPIFANRTTDLVSEDDPERVVRCWGSGDPDETMDEAFEQILIRGLDAIVIQYNFGFFKLPVLARFLTRLRRQGIAVFCVFHSTKEFMKGPERISLGDIREALAEATRLFVHSVPDLNRLRAYGLAANSSVILHGVREPRPPASPAGRVIGSFGFLLPGKGLPELIEAFALLAKTDPLVRLKLVNALYPSPVSDAELSRCQSLITSFGLEGRVELETRFLSEDDALDKLAEVNLVIFPYQETRESSSAAVRLGIASGRPVAVTPLSVFEDVSGAVFRLPGVTAPELAQGIAGLLSREDLEAQSAAMTQRWCAPRQWRVVAERLNNVIAACAVDRRFGAALQPVR